eukprot:TRINITY_DN11996_c1_g1_i4.p1 TRINITY_DN11996_c1_g1~~TRINITY_DN11996_c1_g1_i4.p1  ORF type:complete len:166 (+),score=36.40 TRINITY_DN11996_c1_g1_i4:40-537(+)
MSNEASCCIPDIMSTSQIHSLFEFFDKDGNGIISKQELRQALQLVGHAPSEATVTALLNKVDLDSNDTIDQSEFAKIMQEQMQVPMGGMSTEVLQSFQVFDSELQGFMTEDDFRKMLANYGEAMPESEIQEMLNLCPRSSDGRIDYKGFVMAVEDVSNSLQYGKA